jgi:hypothetical protein
MLKLGKHPMISEEFRKCPLHNRTNNLVASGHFTRMGRHK